ncbi:MAG TPA: hypothetical protein VEH29_16925 [Acidimicrobiales bacterium]|nr:hypothetical protein [Acidimicrobiales bacterium]
MDGLRCVDGVHVEVPDEEVQRSQLNLKLDQVTLDNLKTRAHDLHEPYHRLARELVEWATEQAEQELGLDPVSSTQPAIKELMVLLLHASNQRGDSAVRGMTRLQKLLFVVEQKLESQSRFYAFNYGPFNEEVNDAAEALRIAGFIRNASPVAAGPPSFQQMMAAVSERAGPTGEGKVVEFALSEQGHEAAEKLRESNARYEQLFQFIDSVRKEWDTGDLNELVDRVYEAYPKFASKSVIREEVARRTQRRRAR